MGKSTLEMLGKILAEDREAVKAQQAKIKKGEPSYGPIGEVGEELRIRKADAGGMILCWYGPNGSRDIVVKTVDDMVPLLKKYFEGAGSADSDDDED